MTNLIVLLLNQLLGWKGAFQVGLLTIIAGVLVFFFMRSQEEIKGEDKGLLTSFKVILTAGI